MGGFGLCGPRFAAERALRDAMDSLQRRVRRRAGRIFPVLASTSSSAAMKSAHVIIVCVDVVVHVLFHIGHCTLVFFCTQYT